MPRETTSKVMHTHAVWLEKKKWLPKLHLFLIYRKWKHNQSPHIGWCWLKKVWVMGEQIPNYHFLHANWIFGSKKNTKNFSLKSGKQKNKVCCHQQASCSTLIIYPACLQEEDTCKTVIAALRQLREVALWICFLFNSLSLLIALSKEN